MMPAPNSHFNLWGEKFLRIDTLLANDIDKNYDIMVLSVEDFRDTVYALDHNGRLWGFAGSLFEGAGQNRENSLAILPKP